MDAGVRPKLEEVEEEDMADIAEVKSEGPGTEHLSNGTRGDGHDAPKRPRGRPRKHPIPPSSTSSGRVAKGRSKTGCVTCRRRKKKCDETKPHCLNCQKNAVVCEGYPAKQIWKSGRDKEVEVERRKSVVQVSRGLPVLIDGIETDIDRRLLDHFAYNFSRVLTMVNDDANPFKEIILPMATQHRGLMHSLMCLSGSHLSARVEDPKVQERKHYHFGCAISDLQKNISSPTDDPKSPDSPENPIDDPTIASTVALCLNTICEGETNGEYRVHMDAARHMLETHPPKNPKFRDFIVEFFKYHEVSNSLTSLDRRPSESNPDLRLPDFVPHAHAGALLGIFDGLFRYISEITKLRDKVRRRYEAGYDPAVDYGTLAEAVAIDEALRNWEPSQEPNSMDWTAAQLYRQSTWVYLYRTIKPSKPNDKISGVVNDGLTYLSQLPADAGAQSIMLMPLFLLGCAAFEKGQRGAIEEGFEGLQRYSGLGNILPARRIVEKVWEKMDANMEDSWDWEKIIKEMGYDFLVT